MLFFSDTDETENKGTGCDARSHEHELIKKVDFLTKKRLLPVYLPWGNAGYYIKSCSWQLEEDGILRVPRRLWRCPTSCNLNPFSQAATLLAFDVNDISIASTSTPDTVLLGRIRRIPVFIFLASLLLVFGRPFEPWLTIPLSGRGIGRAMLDGCVSVAEISEVVDVCWR